MLRTILVVSLAVIFANASIDSVVPMDTDMAMSTDLSEARATISDMMSEGASDKDCRKLVTDTITQITETIKNGQKLVDEVHDGSKCESEGQSVVKSTTELKSKADKHLQYCVTMVQKALDHKVEFGSYSYNTLTRGKCDTFFSTKAYTTAKSTHTAAVSAHTKAKGAASEAAVNLKMAISKAKELRHKCLCETKNLHAKTFSDNSAAHDANKKAWTKAHEILCVLDDKKKCDIPACPSLKPGKVVVAVTSEKCAAVAHPVPQKPNYGKKPVAQPVPKKYRL
jgi:hypothetical protein